MIILWECIGYAHLCDCLCTDAIINVAVYIYNVYVCMYLQGSGGVVKGLFDGMSVSGQSPGSTAGPPSATVRPNHTHKKSSSPRLPARSRAEAKKEDNNSPFGDLLGLSSSEMPSNPVEVHS